LFFINLKVISWLEGKYLLCGPKYWFICTLQFQQMLMYSVVFHQFKGQLWSNCTWTPCFHQYFDEKTSHFWHIMRFQQFGVNVGTKCLAPLFNQKKACGLCQWAVYLFLAVYGLNMPNGPSFWGINIPYY
jgi:hypothetical protein